MPRRRLIRQAMFPYHVTTRTNNKEWFKIPLCDVWDFCKESFIYAQEKRPVKIHCFVLMSNHYHLLLSTPNSDIDEFMMFFNLKLSKLILRDRGAINHCFSNRYKWTIVDNQSYLLNTYRYIYQNPLRAKITKNVLSYPYSSIHFTSFESKKFNYQPHIYYGQEKSWFEKRFSVDLEKIITKCLKKEKFTLSSRESSFNRTALSNTPIKYRNCKKDPRT